MKASIVVVYLGLVLYWAYQGHFMKGVYAPTIKDIYFFEKKKDIILERLNCIFCLFNIVVGQF